MKFPLLTLLLISTKLFAYTGEIQDAREGAPAHISAKASIMTWNDGKFAVAEQGENDFVCLVLRDEQGRFEPSCLNRAAMTAIFPVFEYQTQMLSKGIHIEQIYKKIEEKYQSGEFLTPEAGALVYMMSPRNKFYDHFNQRLMEVKPHIMLYTPRLDPAQLGLNNKDGLPGYYNEYPHLGVVHIQTTPVQLTKQ
ncbi:hypothetical protein [Pseudoalteromonas xiamenensis]